MKKVINISSNGIKQAIDDLVNENEILQDKVYKLEEQLQQKENIIKEVREYIENNKQLEQKDIKIKKLSQWDTNKDTRNSRQRIANNKLKDQLQQKENIIKEVREKIESTRIYGLRSGKTLIATLLNDILGILDKGE